MRAQLLKMNAAFVRRVERAFKRGAESRESASANYSSAAARASVLQSKPRWSPPMPHSPAAAPTAADGGTRGPSAKRQGAPCACFVLERSPSCRARQADAEPALSPLAARAPRQSEQAANPRSNTADPLHAPLARRMLLCV